MEHFCKSTNTAESTFGRQCVNDGKLCSRLRAGRNVTVNTAQKIRSYISANSNINYAGSTIRTNSRLADVPHLITHTRPTQKRHFRFYDHRQKYLAFVNTCNEKWKIGERAAHELSHVHPNPPALRLFDAGLGDGSVLSYLLRTMHRRFPTIPFFVVAKEISLEDVRLSLEKLPDRFIEHPSSVIVLTNLYYTEAPWLMPSDVTSAAALNWHELSLQGGSAQEYGEQLRAIDDILVNGWEVRASSKTANPLYVRPSVLVIFREDNRFLLDSVIPRRGQVEGNYDLILAAQPWRARMDATFKVKKVLAPLVRALSPGGRMLSVQSYGQDPGLELVREIWPEENPFTDNRHALLKVLKDILGRSAANYNFNAGSDNKSILRYEMHTLPSEIAESIGTSTLFAAWNASIYVSQIEDERLEPIITSGAYLESTAKILQKHNGMWFNDETFVVSRRRNTTRVGSTISSAINGGSIDV
ncbi:MAG: hypothetical protein CL398_03185 [Acidiferrobacteraceae bacterium]|nr:hypothetical protein [Acidiferrobacteraceae bacterium]